MGRNFIIFEADMTSSVHIDDKNKILILKEGLDNTALKAGVRYLNFTKSGKRFVTNLHYNGSNRFLFVDSSKIYKFRAKDSKIKNVYFKKL